MKKYNLNVAAPTDGRYQNLCSDVNEIFSEHKSSTALKMIIENKTGGNEYTL